MGSSRANICLYSIIKSRTKAGAGKIVLCKWLQSGNIGIVIPISLVRIASSPSVNPCSAARPRCSVSRHLDADTFPRSLCRVLPADTDRIMRESGSTKRYCRLNFHRPSPKYPIFPILQPFFYILILCCRAGSLARQACCCNFA